MSGVMLVNSPPLCQHLLINQTASCKDLSSTQRCLSTQASDLIHRGTRGAIISEKQTDLFSS